MQEPSQLARDNYNYHLTNNTQSNLTTLAYEKEINKKENKERNVNKGGIWRRERKNKVKKIK